MILFLFLNFILYIFCTFYFYIVLFYHVCTSSTINYYNYSNMPFHRTRPFLKFYMVYKLYVVDSVFYINFRDKTRQRWNRVQATGLNAPKINLKEITLDFSSINVLDYAGCQLRTVGHH